MKLRKGERQARILATLELNPSLRVNQLAEDFGVTTETIRRDLAELAEAGRISRTYGGAFSAATRFEPALHDRMILQVEERQAIARAAAERLASHDALLLGGGATMQHFARALRDVQHRLFILTPAYLIAQELSQNPRIQVTMLPGNFNGQEHMVVGHETIVAIERFRAPIAVIGASGLSASGVSEAMPDIGEVYAAMLRSSDRGVVLADHGKFDKRAMVQLTPWTADLTLITDRPVSSALETALQEAATELILAPR
ncbi:DeoR/GlpR family DNA-binding transcription regulator [Rhodobacter sp.]